MTMYFFEIYVDDGGYSEIPKDCGMEMCKYVPAPFFTSATISHVWFIRLLMNTNIRATGNRYASCKGKCQSCHPLHSQSMNLQCSWRPRQRTISHALNIYRAILRARFLWALLESRLELRSVINSDWTVTPYVFGNCAWCTEPWIIQTGH